MTAFGHKQPILAPTDCGHSTACFRPKQVRATSDSRSEVTIPSILPGRRYETSELECHMETPESSWICPSCGSGATTPYCGACGEERNVAVAPIVGDSTATGTRRSFIGRIRASLSTLASPPGRLTP